MKKVILITGFVVAGLGVFSQVPEQKKPQLAEMQQNQTSANSQQPAVINPAQPQLGNSSSVPVQGAAKKKNDAPVKSSAETRPELSEKTEVAKEPKE